MSLYLIHVNWFLHHATSHVIEHCAYVAKLRETGHHVTTEERFA